jgi:hypothetical protein
MKYEHICIYGTTLVGIQGYRNNSCRKCRLVKGGQPQKTIMITINNITYPIPTSHKLYNLRYKIIARCYKAKPTDFKNYQGKGIKVCDEWRNNPEAFYNWCLSNGWEEGLSIDRIDSNGNYEPSNCQFISLSNNAKKSHIDNPVYGERHGKSKLNTSQVIEIKKQLKSGIKGIDISRSLGITYDCVKDIKRNKTWKHIGD